MKAAFEITPQQLADLFITAVEGGCAYWCNEMAFYDATGSSAPYSEASTFKGNWRVEVQEDDGDRHTITPDSLRVAFEQNPERAIEIITDGGDADTADVLIQHGALGEVRYG